MTQLTFSEMCVDAHVSGGASEALVFAVWYVFAGEGVNVLFRQTKVDNVHCVLIGHSKPPHQKILRLHVTIYQVLAVNILQSCYLKYRQPGVKYRLLH